MVKWTKVHEEYAIQIILIANDKMTITKCNEKNAAINFIN